MIKIDDLIKLIVEIYKNSDLKITISSIIMSIVLFLIYLFFHSKPSIKDIEIKLEKEHLEEIEKLKNNISELNKQIFTIKEERDNLKFELTVYRAVEKSENRRTIQGGNDGNRKNR